MTIHAAAYPSCPATADRHMYVHTWHTWILRLRPERGHCWSPSTQAGMCIRIHARACVLVCVALRHRCRRRLDVVHMCTLIAVAAQAVDRTALSPPSTYPFHQAQQLARVLSCLACQYHCAVCCRCGESKRHRTRLRRDAAGCSLFGRSQAFG